MKLLFYIYIFLFPFISFAQEDYSMLVYGDKKIKAYRTNLIDSVSFIKSELVPDSLYEKDFTPFATNGSYASDSLKCKIANHVVKALFFKNKPEYGHKYVLDFYSDFQNDCYQFQVIDYNEQTQDSETICQSTGLLYKYDVCTPLYDNTLDRNIVGYAYLSKESHIGIVANQGEGYERLPYLTESCFTYDDQQIIQSYLLKEYDKSNIVVWGNSITWGSNASSSNNCYTAILRNLVKEYNDNYEVINCGVGGESCQSILVRQGAIGFYLGDTIVLPASSEKKVEIQRMSNYINNRKFKNTYFRDDSYFMLLVQGESGRDNPEYKTVNPVFIDDIECTLTIEGDAKDAVLYINRNESVDSSKVIDAGTFIYPSGTRIPTDILILAIGTNDGFTCYKDNKIDIETSVNQYLELVSLALLKAGTSKYIICSPYAGVALQHLGEDGLSSLENALEKRFSSKFFNTRKYMEQYGMASLLADEIHPNDLGHQLIGEHLFDMLLENGYLKNGH